MKRWSLGLLTAVLGFAGGCFLVGAGLHGQNPAREAPPTRQERDCCPCYRDVVKKVLPAVVSIEARAKVTHARGDGRQVPFNDQQVPPEFRRFFDGFGRVPAEPDDTPR